jgi:hypothetical protein
MNGLRTLLRAERVKLRKSWPLLVAILAPACQVAFLGVIFWFSESRVRFFKPGFRFWLDLQFVVWSLVVMPLATALICELSWEQEREARAWNLLLIQPFPRQGHYLAKALGHLSLAWLSLAIFALLLPIAGLVLCLNPKLFMGDLPWDIFGRNMGYCLLAPVAIVAFQTWLSFRIPGLWAGLASAIAGTWYAQTLASATWLVQLLPWGLAAQSPLVLERWQHLPWAFAFGNLFAAGILCALGTLDFVRQHDPRT